MDKDPNIELYYAHLWPLSEVRTSSFQGIYFLIEGEVEALLEGSGDLMDSAESIRTWTEDYFFGKNFFMESRFLKKNIVLPELVKLNCAGRKERSITYVYGSLKVPCVPIEFINLYPLKKEKISKLQKNLDFLYKNDGLFRIELTI